MDAVRQSGSLRETPGRIKGRCFDDVVTIEAPPELVWDFIADFAGWDSWNPLYAQTSGSAEEGETIAFTTSVPGLKPQTVRAEVRAVLPDELLEFTSATRGGLIKSLRYVELDEISPTRCTVTSAQIVGGPLGRFAARALGERIQEGLAAMNLALKSIAERKWRGARG